MGRGHSAEMDPVIYCWVGEADRGMIGGGGYPHLRIFKLWLFFVCPEMRSHYVAQCTLELVCSSDPLATAS